MSDQTVANSPAPPSAAVLSCPECHETRALEFQEDAIISRHFSGMENGLAIFASEYRVFDEGTKNPRVHCRGCGHDFPLPEGLGLEFV